MNSSPPFSKLSESGVPDCNALYPGYAANEVIMSTPARYQHLDWERDGRNWPNYEASRFVEAGGIRWHLQVMGQGPVLLLLHGTGAANHSWRDLLPLLAQHYTVLAPDLPGHGFTETPPRHLLSLPGMASLLTSLLGNLGYSPELVVGHSAGAAIAARMCLDGDIDPAWVISINGALLPLSGMPGHLFSPIARFLAHKRIWATLLSRRAEEKAVVKRLLNRTGSMIDSRGVDLYARLIRHTDHTAAALGMMANWDLKPLVRDLPRLTSRLLLVVGENDQMVPPHEADRLRGHLPSARIQRLPGCGHLLHEEHPLETVSLIQALEAETGEGEESA